MRRKKLDQKRTVDEEIRINTSIQIGPLLTEHELELPGFHHDIGIEDRNMAVVVKIQKKPVGNQRTYVAIEAQAGIAHRKPGVVTVDIPFEPRFHLAVQRG